MTTQQESRGRVRSGAVDALCAGTSALVSFLLCLYYGRDGIMPPDNSILFDAGWRVLQGQRPIVDFATPNGIPLAYLQAVAFRIGGVNWGAYLATAAICNAVFAAATYRILRSFELRPSASVLYALASGVVFQTPIGTPFLDQGAFLFGLLAILALLHARPTGNREWWVGVSGALLALSCLSKQIPGVFFAGVLGWIALASFPGRRWLRITGWGLVGVLSTLLLFLATIGFRIDDARFSLIELPGSLGALRLDEFARRLAGESLPRFLFTAVWPAEWFPLVRNTLLVSGVLAVLGAGDARGIRRTLEIQSLAGALIAATCGFVSLTVNQVENGFALVPLALGLWHAALPAGRSPWVRRLAGAALAALTLVGAWTFNAKVNVTRIVNDLPFDPARADAAAPAMPEALRPLRWSSPVSYGPEDIAAVVRYARAPGRRAMILSDATFLNALSGQDPVFPALWFHPGLTIPTDAFPDRLRIFEERTIRNMKADGTNAVIIEPDATWMEFELSRLPRVLAFIERGFCLRPMPGTDAFRVWEACASPRSPVAEGG